MMIEKYVDQRIKEKENLLMKTNKFEHLVQHDRNVGSRIVVPSIEELEAKMKGGIYPQYQTAVVSNKQTSPVRQLRAKVQENTDTTNRAERQAIMEQRNYDTAANNILY